MRVLFITGEFPPMQGGVGDCTNEIGKALAAGGVEVGVLTSTHATRDSGGRQPSLFVFPIVKSWSWRSLHPLSRRIHDFQPHVVHVQYQTAAFAMHPAINFFPYLNQRRPFRIAFTFHDLRVPYLFPKAGRVREFVTCLPARFSDAVIATNDEDYAKLEAWNTRRLSLIPIGSNIPTTPPANYQRSAWRAQLDVGENETLLCYFGFLNESKGGETLVRALARVPTAKLIMIGGPMGASDPTNAAYLARVRNLIADLDLSDRVLWTDYTPSEIVTANFFASDLCVMPYREGASYRHGTLMAALAHGMPIVTTTSRVQAARASSLPTLRDKQNCLLVPPDDATALADAIRCAMASPELRAKIAAGARELAQHFTWDTIAQQHLDLYRQILQ